MSVRVSSPVKGYATSAYGWRTLSGQRVFHGGLDIGTGGVSAPVFAMFDGVIEDIVRNREPGQPASRGRVIAPGRSGNAPKIRNTDGERQIYGHVMTAIGWRVGDKIRAGQLLGYTDLSGNTSGHHLHLEIWNANGTTRNPMLDFRAFGLAVGAPPTKYLPPAKRSYAAVRMHERNTLAEIFAAYRVLLLALGYRTPSGVNSAAGLMQVWLNDHGASLRVDGDPGHLTKTALQRRLSDPDLRRPYTGRLTGVWGGVGSPTRIAASALLNDRITIARKG